MNNCKSCEKETKNPKFCCKSCAAKYNNKLSPKRKPEGACKLCFKQLSTQKTYCDICWIKIRENPDLYSTNGIKLKPIEDMKKNRLILLRVHNKIRSNSRNQYFKYFPLISCEKCGYKKYIEVCHIKPVKDFKTDVSDEKYKSDYSKVNAITNLVGLCPNCHWEFDHGDWSIETIDRFKLR